MLINKDLLNSLIKVVGIELQNDRWITVHPNGEEEKGRHLLIKEGEDIGDAMRRQWGVQVKGQQKLDFKGAEKKYQEEQAKKEDEELVELKIADKPTKEAQRAIDESRKREQERTEIQKREVEKYKDVDLSKLDLNKKKAEPKKEAPKAEASPFGEGVEIKETEALSTKTSLEDAEKNYKDVLSKYNAADRGRWERGISQEQYHQHWNDYEKYKKELTKARREYAESIMSNFEKSDDTSYEDRLQARKDRYESMAQQAQQASNAYSKRFSDWAEAVPFGQPTISKQFASSRKKAAGLIDHAVAASKKADYYESKAASVGKAGISADDANAIAKLAQKYKSGVDSAEKRRIIDRVISIHKNKQIAATVNPNEDYSHLGFNVERNADLNRLQLKFGGIPDPEVRSVLKKNGFRWSPSNQAWQRQSGANAEASLKSVADILSMKQKATSSMQ